MELDVKDTALMVKNTPLPGYTLPNLLRLLAQNHFHVSPRYLPRFTYSLALCGIITPFYIRERLKYDTKIKHTQITKDPVFIIGHWRCGTTLLHNILSRDHQFGYFSTFQAYIPTVYLSSEKLFKPLVVSSLPKKRPMDNGDLDADLPQEDQYAIAAFSPYSYYNGWCFPQNMQHYYDYICMTNATPQTIEDWKQTYLYLLKKMTLYHNGRQLLLKNQDNTAKIPILLELFPDAKFIYINRNPYDLYMSMMKFMSKVIPRYCIQTPPPIETLEGNMIALYTQMTKKYLHDKSLIPTGNLAEVKYETLYKQPLRTIHSLYNKLNIDGYDKAEQAFKDYIVTQKTIHDDHSHYTFSEPVLRKIENHWGFAVKEYKYPRPLAIT
jgi:omega-hydroxy-beta-dihydromenaquinone-9 sulfotransferase